MRWSACARTSRPSSTGTERFSLARLRHPIVLAPLAGGPCTPGLVAAVSGAGGLGQLATGYRTPQQMADDIAGVRALTDEPFGVNLFVPSPDRAGGERLARYADQVRRDAAERGYPAGEARWDDDGWPDKVEQLVASPVPVVSFTFGCPPAAVVEQLRAAGSTVWVTVTNPADAAAAVAAGADALVLQGAEAGGHRSTFDDEAGEAGICLLPLLARVRATTDLPLVAAGGIMDGRSVAAVLAAGAAAAQLGTAFLLADEAGTSPLHREAILAGGRTALTRAFTGRLARGIENRFMRDHPDAPSAYPQLHHLTSPMRAAAREAGDAGSVNLWAGEAFSLARSGPAANTVTRLGREYRAALEQMNPVR